MSSQQPEVEEKIGKLVSKYKCYKLCSSNKPVASDSIRSRGNFSGLFFAITIIILHDNDITVNNAIQACTLQF